jgi:hypothetical protein
MLEYANNCNSIMTKEEWQELKDLKEAITLRPASVVPEKQERFTELLVKSWSYIETPYNGPQNKLSHPLDQIDEIAV